jgi:hypothetical protein
VENGYNEKYQEEPEVAAEICLKAHADGTKGRDVRRPSFRLKTIYGKKAWFFDRLFAPSALSALSRHISSFP